MPLYLFRATDPTGVVITDTIEAATPEAAVQRLRERELTPVSVEPSELATRQHGRPIRHEPVAERPGPAPRQIPPHRSGFSPANFLLLFGGIWFVIPFVMFVIFLTAGGPLGVLAFLGIFLLIGAGIFLAGLKLRTRRRHILTAGRSTMATIVDAGHDHSLRTNGRPSLFIEYEYEVEGHRHTNRRRSFNVATTDHQVDDRIWVLYNPDNPSKSAEWPPL